MSGVSLGHMMAILPFVTLVAALPVSFGGWGVREGAFIFALGLSGVPQEAAFMLSVHIGLLSLFATALAGVPALLSGEIRGMVREAATAPAQRTGLEAGRAN